MTMSTDRQHAGRSPRWWTRPRIAASLAVAAGLAVLAAANIHLVYVAVTSQPDCVPHVKEAGSGTAGAIHRAAKSSC